MMAVWLVATKAGTKDNYLAVLLVLQLAQMLVLQLVLLLVLMLVFLLV